MNKIQIFFMILVFSSGIFLLSLYLNQKNTKQTKFSIYKGLNALNLKTHKGDSFILKNVLGAPSIFFFGFLNCPDICPNTLTDISKIITNLGSDSKEINFYFVTVDPERDQVLEMNEYLSHFNNEIIGITGQIENIKKFLKHMHVYYKKIYTDEDFYTLDHASNMLIFKKNGDFFGTISSSESQSMIENKIKSLF